LWLWASTISKAHPPKRVAETVGARLLKDSFAASDGSYPTLWQKEDLLKDFLEEEGLHPW
jgi:hypothetical protein